jgi:hypothetical protein
MNAERSEEVVKPPSEEDEKILEECVKLWKKAIESDALNEAVMKDMFGLGPNVLHASMNVGFTSPKQALRCFSSLALSESRNLQLQARHFQKAFADTPSFKLIGSASVQYLQELYASGVGANSATAETLASVLKEPLGAVAWIFEIRYNEEGDCQQESCMTAIRHCTADFAADIRQAAPSLDIGNAIVNDLKSHPVSPDFKPDAAYIQKILDNVSKSGCRSCKKTKGQFKRCTQCKCARYCSAECQRADWKQHRSWCKLEHRMLIQMASLGNHA